VRLPVARGKTALVYIVPALAIVLAWVRIERPHAGLALALMLAAIAFLPAVVRPPRPRLGALVGAVLLGGWVVLGTSLLRPGKLGDGALEFYDVALPFNPHDHPRMQSAALMAAFGFCLVLAFALAGRRPLLAAIAVVAGAGWPGTLLRGGSVLMLGGLILAAVLVILMGLRPRSGQALAPALVAGGLIVAGALALSSSPAVAKGELLHWEGWDLYTKPDRAVGITYVWDSNYSGLNWPKKRTTVLKIAAPSRSLYWRATTLDAYVGGNWIEDLSTTFPVLSGDRADLSGDPLLPARARESTKWVKQQVVVEALLDRHLVGADVPVAYAARDVGSVSYTTNGTALVVPGSDRGKSYAVWSYVPRPTPAQLARSRPVYPPAIADAGEFLTVERGVALPPFGYPSRDAIVARLISSRFPAYYGLYHAAKQVVGKAPDPYAAVVGLESWLRDSGRFHYDEHPPSVPGVPPLVAFVTTTRSGYCQHFAGAMALMLRYLGIPARVAAGFTSGKYDDGSGTWTVTDHDAHAWVEVWFRGYGWLPFDPTPGRGRIAASYTASSKSFDAKAAAALVGPANSALRSLLENRARTQQAGQSARGERARSIPLPAASGNRGIRLVGLLLLVLVAIGLSLFLGKLAFRRARYLRRDPRRVAAACRRELVEFLLDQRVDVSPSSTLSELARAIDSEFAVAAGRFVDAAGSARFGRPGDAGEAAGRARRELRALERVLRRRLGLLDRLLGALSIQSLRAV